jgi:predicted nucleic acid-binding protein
MRELIKNRNGIIPTIVISETIQLIYSREGKQKADMIYLSLVSSGIKIEDFSSSIAKDAGILKSTYKHIPMGDCIIAATAMANNGKILSDDPHFDIIQEIKRNWI